VIFKPLNKQAEWDWIQARARPVRCEDSQGIVAYNTEDEIQAITVFDSFIMDACSVHLAIDNPFVIRHGFLSETANHLFNVCERNRIFARIPATNTKSIKLTKHVGFSEVARIPEGFTKDVDFIVMRLDKEDCHWLTKLKEVA
jgi:RimJ/RimL family protein N-acetyltransferase